MARIQTITARWLVNHRVTLAMVQAWLSFYEQVYDVDPANDSAEGRIELMRYCVLLLEE
ncbi:MAG: hypothetical protein HYX51_00795 [Chloroflexi bacterium]|nr:hypothetical protein [Chloroflexota bacterium]